MRLHRLEVQAFGPFAAPQRVDFDALAEGGLFLLHGPTGAGKTSVLDAVCFALYGRVPGVRAAASRLRSDHADPELPPQVVCEFSVGARRFEVTRSPAWERPKRRGEGTTEEKARVLLREADQGSAPGTAPGAEPGTDEAQDGWRVLTQRSDEAAHLLDAVLGLSLDQFTKLVLLAQGEFAAFLRADAESRRAMLERLFDTERFTQLQSWLHDRQLRLRRRAEDCDRTTRELVARAQQAAAVLPAVEPPPPPAPTGPVQGDLLLGFGPEAEPEADPDPETAPGELVTLLHRRAVHAWETTAARRAVSRKKATRARSAHQKVERLAALQREHADLTARVAALQQAAELHEATARRLRDADRAVPLAALAPELLRARQQAERAVAALAALEPDTRGTGAQAATDADLRAAATGLTEQLARLEDLRLAEQRLTRLTAEVAAQQPLVTAAEQAHRALLQDQAAIAGQLAAVREQQAAAGAVAGSVDALRQAEQQAAEVVAAVQRRDRLTPELAQATTDRDQARAGLLDARDRVLDLRERRLAGMAAELAERLAAGDPCPVCGAVEHPAPAGTGPAPVTPADERAAAERLRRAEQQLAEREAVVTGLAEQLAAATAVAGTLTLRTAETRHRKAGDSLTAVDDATRLQERLVAVIREAENELALLAGQVAAAAERLDGTRAAAADLAARRDELAARIADALGCPPDQAPAEGAVAGRIAALAAELAGHEARLAAREAAATARERLADAERSASAAAAEAGFETLEAALAALLPAARHAELQQAVRGYQDELAAATARLQHPELVEAAVAGPADPAQTSTTLELAVADEDRAAREAALCEQAVEALAGLTDALAGHLRVAGPVLAEFRLVNDLSRCADGTGGDNTLRMSLSAYVLAARLEQVAEAASARLLQMSGGRYALTHTDAVQKGRARSGLGLLVVDGWTGQARDTASLSGGESFYTSLALALGLADVVSAESGGTAIETLFVDEGFGSLDEQTLEDVMDVLDGLRAGGRAVGLVSHVADLRDRIPAQLEVLRGRDGSTLRQSVA